MVRSARKWGVAVAFGAVAWAATPGGAVAQFPFIQSPLGRPGTPLLNFRPVNLYGFNPATGQVNVGWSALSGSMFRPGSLQGRPYAGGSNYLSAGSGLGYQSPAFKQQQNAVSRAQKAGHAYNTTPVGARAAIGGQWAYEQGGAKPADVAVPAGVNRGLLAAGPESIASGAALNDLLAAVPPLEAKAIRVVDSALVPPDLAQRIAFDGGPTADAVNLLRAPDLAFPAPLKAPAFDALRADLGKAFTAVGEVAGHNRATVISAADRLLAASGKARAEAVPLVRDLPFHDAATVVRFFNHLDAAARLLKDPDLSGAFVPGWAAVGVSVRDLARHMTRFHLTFAPAPDAEAYSVLHRGLADYYVGLARAGK